MAQVHAEIEVEVPVSTAYSQWTQFEEFPKFMEGVHEVHQLDDRRLHWKAEVGGHEKEWEAEIKEQVPDQRIVWSSIDGEMNAGIVQFMPMGDNSTRVTLDMSYDPEGIVETLGDKLGFMSRRVNGDLKRFRDFIQEREAPTGAYRETLENPKAPGGFTNGRPGGDLH